jgi:hypothetical protein
VSAQQSWYLDYDVTRINVIDASGYVVAAVSRENRTYAEALSVARQIAALPTLMHAMNVGLDAVEAVTSQMSVGDRFSDAGQSAIDALPVLRAAILAASKGGAS